MPRRYANNGVLPLVRRKVTVKIYDNRKEGKRKPKKKDGNEADDESEDRKYKALFKCNTAL